MDLREQLKPGLHVVGADRTEYGTVERYDDVGVYVGGRPVPYGAFEGVDRDRLYVNEIGRRYFSGGREAPAVATEDEVRVPLLEERLVVGTRTRELGTVELRKSVEAEPVSVPIELRRDQVDVQVIDIEERPATIAEGMDAFTEEVIRVPVRGEEVIVTKEAVVKGEVAVGRTHVSERDTIGETLRQEVVDVAVSYDEARPAFREHFDRLQARLRQTGGPTFRARDFADAEPLYRLGFEARNDPRFRGRSFDDVEAELRERHLRTDSGDAAAWDVRRQELRAGWEHGQREAPGTAGTAATAGDGDEHGRARHDA